MAIVKAIEDGLLGEDFFEDTDIGSDYMKKKKEFPLLLVFSIAVMLFFAWVIWSAVLVDVVPWHRTLFLSYEDFYEASMNTDTPKTIPEEADDLRYYWGSRFFIKIAGYRMKLSEADYAAFVESSIKRYQTMYGGFGMGGEVYLFRETNEPIVFDDQFIEQNDIKEINKLYGKKLDCNDYYIIAMYKEIGYGRSRFSYLLGNDEKHSIIELSRIDRREK